MLRFRALGWIVASALVVACAADRSDEEGQDVENGDDAILKTSESPPWLYEGPLPALSNPSIVVSLVGHTLRITGTLPVGFDENALPWYVVPMPRTASDKATRISVVYPAATGKMVDGAWNNVPGHYDHLNVRPYRPKDADQSDKEHWGGFPFLNYHDARRFAFHGPIDFATDGDVTGDGQPDDDWRLVRGRISKGCQRMQGEHVTELTHMLGFDMRYAHSTKENGPDKKNAVEGKYISISLDVLADGVYDALPGSEGDVVLDVDFPKHETVDAIPAGKKPFVAKTWDANEMRAWSCGVLPKDNPNLDKKIARVGGLFDGSYCARTRGTNLRDPKTGELLSAAAGDR